MNWVIDKENKIPLYLQLKDLVKYHISTGSVQEGQRLPPINELAERLGINFETVRKAYKELEREGFISSKRGRGTFTTASSGTAGEPKPPADQRAELIESLGREARRLMQLGMEVAELREVFEQALKEAGQKSAGQVVFTECNPLQVNEISGFLKETLGLNIKPVLISDLRAEIAAIGRDNGELLGVLTTGFHVGEVRSLLSDIPVKIDFVITNMSPETRRELSAYDKGLRFGFICRDQESIIYKDILRAELGLEGELIACIVAETEKVEALFASADVLLVSPPAYEDVKQIAPPHLPVYNVFDRVDPISLQIIKDNIANWVRK